MKQQLLSIGLCLAISVGVLAEESTTPIGNQLASLKATSQAFNQVAKKGIAAVVNISATRVKQAAPYTYLFGEDIFRDYFQMPEQEQSQKSVGSGVIVDTAGYILTNNHVIDGADKVTVTLSDKREFEAEIVGTDPKTDIAVLKIKADQLPALDLGNSDAIEVGDWAIAIGSPFGLSKSMTVGIISAKGRSNVGIVDYENFIQTDAAINPGNSGGALLNIDGELIGINTAIFTKSGGYNGIGFAIPVNLSKKVMADLIKSGKVIRGWLGVVIQSITPELQRQFALKTSEGALISDIVPDSPAEKAGIKRGDIIVSYDGKPIQNYYDLRNTVGQAPIGKRARVEIIRNGRTRLMTVTIKAYPDDEKKVVQKDADILGIQVSEVTNEFQKKYRLSDDAGVLVTQVAANKPAAGILKAGDVILEIGGQEIYDISDYLASIQSLKKRTSVLIWIKRGAYSQYVVVRLN